VICPKSLAALPSKKYFGKAGTRFLGRAHYAALVGSSCVLLGLNKDCSDDEKRVSFEDERFKAQSLPRRSCPSWVLFAWVGCGLAKPSSVAASMVAGAKFETTKIQSVDFLYLNQKTNNREL
jgi:hypothetical protein